MKKIKAYADYGYVGADREEIIEVDDDATEEEIDALIWEWAIEYVSINWQKVKED